MTRIFIIRHAEAEGNLYRCAHGQSEGLITPRGYLQIEQLKKRFAGEKIDTVYSSDLIRTRVTATSITQPHNLPLNTTEKLREVRMGIWEEMAWGDIEHEYPQMCEVFGLDPGSWYVQGCETYEEVISRVTEFITEAAQKHDGETIALFTHGFAIRSFFCRLMGYTSKESIKLPYCDNTAVALITYDDGKFNIEYQSDNSHLKEDESTFAQQSWWRDDHLSIRETENMRYEKLDADKHKIFLDAFLCEPGVKPDAELEFASFFHREPAGMLGISKVSDDTGMIDYIFLMPDTREQKFAVQLLGKAIGAFREKKIEHIRIEAEKDSAIMELCMNQAFETIEDKGDKCLLGKNIRNW